MTSRTISLLKILPLAGVLCLLNVSCASNEELEERLEKRNERYEGLQDRREMRQDARDERDDAWRDRVMN